MLIIADHADYPIERDNNDRGYVWLAGEAARLAAILGEKAGPEFRFRRRNPPDLGDLGQIPFRGLAPMGADEARHEIPG